MKVDWAPDGLTIDWGCGQPTRYPAIWLRDQCQEDRDRGTGQRLVDIVDLPEHPRIQNLVVDQDQLSIDWAGESRSCVISIEWLESIRAAPAREPSEWAADQAGRFLWSDYSAIQADDKLKADWLAGLLRDGLAFLTGIPGIQGEVENVARLFGYVTETNYGRIFDVRAMATPNNLAYTAWGLGVHTDNPYREPVPGYQLLHCLTPSPEGGASLFVDGFAVAKRLRQDDSAAFHTLSQTPVDFGFRDAQAELAARRPLLQLDQSGAVQAIHDNNRSLSTARLPLAHSEEFFRSYRAFAWLLRDPQFEWSLTLQAGQLVMFDNSRILHGRTAFRGQRHLQGCYVGRDGVSSSSQVLRRKLASEPRPR